MSSNELHPFYSHSWISWELVHSDSRSFVGILATLLVWGASDAISTSSFLLFLTNILTIRHDKFESCPQNDVTHYCHVSFWPRDSNAIFEGKIAQLQAHVKSTIFVLNISNFGIVYF